MLAFKLSRYVAIEVMHSFNDILKNPDKQLELSKDDIQIVIPITVAKQLISVIGNAVGATGDETIIDDVR